MGNLPKCLGHLTKQQQIRKHLSCNSLDDKSALLNLLRLKPFSVVQATAKMAFDFCRKYDRKIETRRLCELLRNHLSNLAKYASQAHAVNLANTDSLHAFLDIHFVQLNAVSELEQWQEAFRSLEDIHGLLTLNRKPVKPSWMINYYEKLTRLTEISGQWVFHAAAWNKYQGVKSKEVNLTKTAAITVLSALAVPIIDLSQVKDGAEDTTSKNKLAVWCRLLSLTQPPHSKHIAYGSGTFWLL